MKVDREYYVTLRVTKDRSVDLSEDLEGILENRKVKVAAIMTATLKGGKAFNIQPLSSEEQALQENEYTEWEWQVTPREGGLHLLTITVARKVDTDLGPGFKDERVLEEKFSVTITPAERIKKFAAGNWQWLWGVITAPPIILLTAYKRARGRKSTNTGTREQVDAQPANEGP